MTGKLSERCMLAQLHISAWAGMLIDKEVTDATNESYKAAKEAGRYNKRLVASSFLKGVSGAHSRARHIHRLLTLPWEDDGTRVLAATGYITYVQKMKEARQKVEAEVKAFLDTPDAYVTEAKTRLGKMFNIDDYPSQDDLKGKFGFDVEIKPMPDAGDFRAQVSDENMKSIIRDIERRTDQRLENAMNDIFKRVAEVVGHMSERLRAYQPAKDGSKAEGVIRASLVYNIHEMATEVLPVLNITNDPRVEDLQKNLLAELYEHSPEILTADTKIRQATISKADKLLKKINSYMK
jgi:hypothetical protein